MNSDKKIGFLQEKIQTMLFDIYKNQSAYAPLVSAAIAPQSKNWEKQMRPAASTFQIPANQPLYNSQQKNPKTTRYAVANPKTLQFPPE